MDIEGIVARAIEDAGAVGHFHASSVRLIGGQLTFSIDMGSFTLEDAVFLQGEGPDSEIDVEDAWEGLVDAIRAYMRYQIR